MFYDTIVEKKINYNKKIQFTNLIILKCIFKGFCKEGGREQNLEKRIVDLINLQGLLLFYRLPEGRG